MGDTWLIYMPADPWHVPPADRLDAAIGLLRDRMPLSETALAVRDQPEVLWPDENWGGVACPRCGEEWEDDWWWEAAEQAIEDGPSALTLPAPCYGEIVSFLDLDWRDGQPAGLARCTLTVIDPPSVDEIGVFDPTGSDDALAGRYDAFLAEVQTELAAVLGCPVRLTIQHF